MVMPSSLSARRTAIAWVSAALLAVSSCTRGAQESPRQNPSIDPHAAHQKSSAEPAAVRRVPNLSATPAPGPAPSGMVWIPGGEFWMGCDECGMPDALPVHL